MTIHVSPELRLPSVKEKDTSNASKSESLHPFWFIDRSCKRETSSIEVIREKVSVIATLPFEKAKEAGVNCTPMTETVNVQLPLLVNTKLLKEGEAACLFEPASGEKEKQKKGEKETDAYMQVLKRLRTREKGAYVSKK